MKKFLSLLLAALLCLGLFAGCKKQENGGTIAKVGDREISFNDFLSTLDYYAYYMGLNMEDASSKETMMQLAENILTSMVLSEVVLAKGEEMGYYEFSDEEKAQIDEDVKSDMDSGRESISSSLKENNPDLSDAELETKINLEMATQGYIEEDLRTYYEDSLVYDKVYAHFTEEISVSDDDVKAEFDKLVEEAKTGYLEGTANFEDDALSGGTIYYTPAGYRRVQHILIGFDTETSTKLNELYSGDDQDAYNAYLEEALAGIKPKAEEVLAKAKADGANFAELMGEYSTDPGAAYYPDGYVVGQENSTYHESFVAGAFALKNVGDVSDLVSSPSGYHIIRLEEILTEGAANLDDVKENVASSLLETRKSDSFFEMSESWRDEMKVKTYPEKYQVHIDNYYANLEASASADPSASPSASAAE